MGPAPSQPQDPAPPAGEATQLLASLKRGEAAASGRLLELIYAELKSLAAAALRGERADHTLQPTALVHEAWLRLVDQTRVEWQGRAHFLGTAALAMRRVLVDHARARGREKRGGGAARVPLEGERIPAPTGLDLELDVLALDRGLEELARHSERAARVVELRFFAGLSEEDTAEVLGVARATVTRDWRAARAWLSDWLQRGA
ncbi:MAG TPA: sigma-70 family RNA polymerase sigma factor [Planctomycetota bacterium]